MSDEVEVQQVGDLDETPVGETIANAAPIEDAIAPGSDLGTQVSEEAEEPAEAAEDATEPAAEETDEPAAEDVVEEEPAPVRTTDEIGDGEWNHETLEKADGAQHRVKYVAWGDKVLVRPVSYAGPDFLCDSLEHAAVLVPLLP